MKAFASKLIHKESICFESYSHKLQKNLNLYEYKKFKKKLGEFGVLFNQKTFM